MDRRVRHNFVTNEKNIPNIGAYKNIKQALIHKKGEVDNNTIIVEGFNISVTSRDKSSRQRINKATVV